jgi:hypothetical protein
MAKKEEICVFKSYYMPILMYGAETWIKADINRITAAEKRLLRSIEGKTKRDRIRNEKFIENLKLNNLEDKLPNNRMRWFGHILRVSEGRIPEKVLNMNVKGYRGKEECGKKLRRQSSCAKTEMDGEVGLSNDSLKC